MPKRWPERLWIVRHGESAGNVARDAAHAAGLAMIDISVRDADVALSPLGEEQARALGQWYATMPSDERPNVVLVSPYRRARETAEIIRAAGALSADSPEFVIDERLREKEFGVVDRLTTLGIRERLPGEAKRRADLGKFYYRPPGGESWCDVILRLRSVLDTVSLHFSQPGSRVLVVAHQVIVLCFRYLIEQMTEEEILAIDAKGDVANCGVTEYVLTSAPGVAGAENVTLQLVRYNFTAPVQRAGAPVTSSPDAAVAPR